MIKLQHGYILLIVLIFLQVFILLGLSGLNSALIVFKTNSFSWERQQLLLHAQAILYEVENKLILQTPACLVPVISAAQLSKKSLSWWEQYACRGMQYYYVAEFLGTNACAIVSENSAKYYRITLLDLSNRKLNKLILQSVVALKNNDVLTCTDKPYKINMGEQMQREL